MQVFFSNCYMLSSYALYKIGRCPYGFDYEPNNRVNYVNFDKQTKTLEKKVCKDIAYRAIEACTGIGTAKELRAIEEVFAKGGLAINYFKELQPFMVACLQQHLSMPIINILIKHDLYDPDWAKRRNIELDINPENHQFGNSISILGL